ncbi:6621_t:CDS:2 [Entrophospora sp. SA101]|nr:6621_t:CDS:2 [Entrophospora sp. SA101]
MLRSTSCKNIITPFPRKESYFEFWTRAEDESKNKETFRYLYENGFLNLYPDQQQDSIPKFWKCFKESLKNNNKGSNVIAVGRGHSKSHENNEDANSVQGDRALILLYMK